MKILILGDVHGEWRSLNRTIFKAFDKHPDITHMVQVGDLAYAWPRSKPFQLDRRLCNTMVGITPDEVFERIKSLPFYWLDGNHENHNILNHDGGASQPGMIYQPRGSVVEFSPNNERAMFFGGASSIDKAHRIENITWWAAESITHWQVNNALSREGPIDIMFSHEFPASFPYASWKDDFGMSDRNALECIKQKFKPAFWVFGHHHEFAQGETDGTQWACAAIIDDLSYIIWNGYNLIFEK